MYSVTKHAGFVRSDEYFNKQVFSRDVSGYKHVVAGDFAYATIHLDEGSIGVAPEEALISPMYTAFRVDGTRIDRRYLIRLLKSPRALSKYSTMGSGSVHRRRSIPFKVLSTLEIPLPPLPEQRRIADILDRADAIRRQHAEVQSKLIELKVNLVASRVKIDTPREPFGELVASISNGLSPATDGQVAATVLTLSAVTRGKFDLSANKPGLFGRDLRVGDFVADGDFLLCRGNGNPDLVGRGVLARGIQGKYVYPDTVIRTVPDHNVVDATYLEAVWGLRAVRDQILQVARTTNGTYKVNQKTLGSVLVPVLPADEQSEVRFRLEAISAAQVRALEAAKQTEALFSSLQSWAFHGKL